MDIEVFIYHLHFEEKIGRAQTAEQRALWGLPPREREYRAHCQHYTGATEDLPTRIQEHRTGKSKAAKLTQAAKRRGIEFQVVRVWVGDWELEKEIKRRKEGPSLCPVCNPGNGYARNYKELTPEEIERALVPF